MKANREITATMRVVVALLLMVGVALVLPQQVQPFGRLLIAWNAGVLGFLAICVVMISGKGPEEVRVHAQRQAEGRYRVLAGTLVVCLVSLLAVAFVLLRVQQHDRDFRLQVFLCVLTVFSAWLLLQTVFALFYARFYYHPAGGGHVAGGLRFSGDAQPDYWDFTYFSYVIGTSYSTSDTNIESRTLRRTVLIQSLVSFVFYTVLIGVLMNAIAALL
ncbi:MAG: DUF1345 domain-containing protein [Longimicrobiales bacterium]